MDQQITDEFGQNTLQTIAEANKFNKWMFQTIEPFTNGKILEIGSGLGNISKFFLNNGAEIMLSDLREEYCSILQKKFQRYDNYLGVEQIDLIHPDFEDIYVHHLDTYETVFALNVVEHIEKDHLAIENCTKLLRDNGVLIILVPSYQNLYNKFDEELGHFKRYTTSSLVQLFLRNDLDIIHQQYFNLVGILGWYMSGSLIKTKNIPSGQMKIYDKLVPLWKLLDKMLLNKIGLSAIVVGQIKK